MAKIKPEEMRGGLNALFNRSDLQAAPMEEQPANTPETTATEGASAQAQPSTATPENPDLLEEIEDGNTKELIRQRRERAKRGRPRKGEAHIPADQGYLRITTIVPEVEWSKIREIAARENLQLKDVMEMALRLAVEIYERKNGKLLVADKHTGEKDYLFKI